MSQQEFERTDQEVIDLVNGAASPHAKQMADAIEKELNHPVEPKPRCENDECAEERMTGVALEEMHRRWRRGKIIIHSLYVLASITAAVAMVIALKNPEYLVHIANVTILICGSVAALHSEKIAKLLRK